jgi:hypothetical protein
MAAVVVLATAGQAAVAATLWVALATLGHRVPVGVVLLVVPLAKLGGLAPTPGGMGSSEAVLVMLLVATTGVGAVDASVAALLYRTTAFWLPAAVGGTATAWFVAVGGRDADGGNAGDATGDDAEAAGGPATTDCAGGDGAATGTTAGGHPKAVLVAAAAVAALVGVAVHRNGLLFEPASATVHLVHDAAVVLLAGVLAWTGLDRLAVGRQ